jgi:GNAT superfamily N-acetyltransferase
MSLTVNVLDAPRALAAAPALGAVLAACVEAGASVNFMQPYSAQEGARFFEGVARDVAEGASILVVAELDGALVGTVQARPAPQPNQPHRFDVAKMLVHPSARRRGVGEALLKRAEAEALARGRWLGVLDTVTGSDGFRLYERCGWRRAGEIPDYALWPQGGLCATTFFYKRLEQKA